MRAWTQRLRRRSAQLAASLLALGLLLSLWGVAPAQAQTDDDANESVVGCTVIGTGAFGSGDGELGITRGLFLANDGSFYLSDTRNDRVQRFPRGSDSGSTITSGLRSPSGVFVVGDTLYVADTINHQVQAFAPGRFIGRIVAGTGSGGDGDDQLQLPEDVFVAADGTVYVADTFNNRVQAFAPGDTFADTVATGLRGPAAIFVDRSGTLYVADTLNGQVRAFPPGDSQGLVVAVGLGNPTGLFVDRSGTIFVADTLNNRIRAFRQGSIEGTTVAGTGDAGSAANELSSPSDVTVDIDGTIYVADTNNYRIQAFGPRCDDAASSAEADGESETTEDPDGAEESEESAATDTSNGDDDAGADTGDTDAEAVDESEASDLSAEADELPNTGSSEVSFAVAAMCLAMGLSAIGIRRLGFGH